MDTIKTEDIDIAIDQNAIDQIKLMLENDYTLEDKVFRLQIGGKGCDGFTYELGFSETNADDIIYKITDDLNLHLDPFSAYFCRKGKVHYHFDPNADEGLTFENFNQEEFHGKFFKDESTIPDFLKNKNL